MDTTEKLNLYQKAILILMIGMALIFAVIYAKTISRVGFAYNEEILVPSQENGSTVYSGKIDGQPAKFTVSADKAVVFQCGSKTYGPYTAKKDPTAIPKDHMNEGMTGVEIRQGDEILFRGGYFKNKGSYYLFGEDGSPDFITVSYAGSDGIERGPDGNVIDRLAPSASAILELVNGPKLTHKGAWGIWIGAVIICGMNALSIIFVDELFHFFLRFRIRSAELAEPSGWEITGRYVSWTGLLILAFWLFMFGLGYIS